MRATVPYRISAGLLVLFAIGHTTGFHQVEPRWGVNSLVGSMRSIHFDVMGFNRTYWDFFVGAGYSVGLFYLFAAVLSWQLGGLGKETLKLLPLVTWALALCFVGVTIVSWVFLFTVPIVFSALISACLLLAAWLAGR